MNKKMKNIITKEKYLDLKNKREYFLGSMKDWYPVGHKLAQWISVREYIENGWKSCLDSHMELIIDEFPAADAIWLYLQIYEWLEHMEGKYKISEEDKEFIDELVKSYALF